MITKLDPDKCMCNFCNGGEKGVSYCPCKCHEDEEYKQARIKEMHSKICSGLLKAIRKTS